MKGKLNQKAVDNFLGSMDTSEPEKFHKTNLIVDFNMYNWNLPTYYAILEGIENAYEESGE